MSLSAVREKLFTKVSPTEASVTIGLSLIVLAWLTFGGAVELWGLLYIFGVSLGVSGGIALGVVALVLFGTTYLVKRGRK